MTVIPISGDPASQAALSALVLTQEAPEVLTSCPRCVQPPVKPCLYVEGPNAGTLRPTTHHERRVAFLISYIERKMTL